MADFAEYFLDDLQQDLADRLQADEYFHNIPVLTEKKADLTSEISRALGILTEEASCVGACVVVLSPTATVQTPNVPGGVLAASLTVRVLENPIFSQSEDGAGKSAIEMAERVVIVLLQYRPHGLGQALIPMEPTVQPVQDDFAPVAYDVRFSCRASNQGRGDKVQTPTISPNGGAYGAGAVTLSCADASAELWYTTDGNYPSERQQSARKYSAAVTLTCACTLRVVGYETDHVASDAAAATFT